MSMLGNIYFLKYPLIPDDHDGHYYAVVQDDQRYEHVRIIYGTSVKADDQEKWYAHAPRITVQPDSLNNLRLPTHFVPAVGEAPTRTRLHGRKVEGSVLHDFDRFRQAIRRTIGYRTGLANSTHTPESLGSLRGELIRVRKRGRDALAVVITDHRFSRERQYQLAVPVEWITPDLALTGGGILLEGFGKLAARFGVDATSLLAAPEAFFSAKQLSGEVVSELGVRIAGSDLESIEEQVASYMSVRRADS